MHSETTGTRLTQVLACGAAAIGIACIGYAVYALAPASTATTPQAQAATKTYSFEPTGDAHENWKTLNGMLEGDDEKVVTIEPGSDFEVDAPLRPGNNTTINATGSTITITKRGSKTKQNLIFPAPRATNYNSFKNLTINGGKWRSWQEGGYTGGLIALAHGQNIVLDGIDVNANWDGHAVEIMACKDVTIRNCKIWGIGKLNGKNDEEILQIDLATKKSTPQIAKYGKEYVQGQTCQNVTVENCYIDGARGFCASYNRSEDGKWLTKYHSNITLKGNVILGRTSEAVALFNTVGAKVTGNVLVSRSTGKTGAERSMGIMASLYGKAPKAMKKSTLSITGNTVYGMRNAIEVRGLFTTKKPRKSVQRFGKVVVKNNKAYAKAGKSSAIFVVHEGRNTKYEARSGDKETVKKNKTYKWNGKAVAASWNGQSLSL